MEITYLSLSVIMVMMSLLNDMVHSLSPCDKTRFPETGCSDDITTKCDTSRNLCICRDGFPVALSFNCTAYTQVNQTCLFSNMCYKSVCLDDQGEEIENESEGKNGTCRCTNDRIFDPIKGTCVLRLIYNKCKHDTDCDRSAAYCTGHGSLCACRPHFGYNFTLDQCVPASMFPSICAPGTIVEAGGKVRCRPSKSEYYPYFRRPSYANFMWPIFAFFLVVLMFKLLKEGLERECPNGSFVDLSPSHGRSRDGGTGGSSGTSTAGARINVLPIHVFRSPAGNLTNNRVGDHPRSPSMDTVVSMPPPYETQNNTINSTINTTTTTTRAFTDRPPTYEEATRK